MSDFNVRSDSINVEQIMEQIRARIREKRGVDYTEEQLREIAAVKLEKFLDPRGVRSDLLEQFKRRPPLPLDPIVLPTYTFEATTIYETHRGLLGFFRKLLNPILKLFFNPNAIVHALHSQTRINELLVERDMLRERQRQERREMDALYYEVIHNLVFEMTRVGIDSKNLKMRVESIASRLEFNERRARALESVVAYRAPVEGDGEAREESAPAPRPQPPARQQYQPDRWTPPAAASSAETTATTGSVPSSAPAPTGQPMSGGQPATNAAPQGQPGSEGPGQRSRRRRRRRGRRGGAPATAVMGQPAAPESTGSRPQDGEAPAAETQTHADADAPAVEHEPAREPESAGPGTDTDPQ